MHAPAWIWADPHNLNPRNRLTWFRKRFTLAELPADGTLRLAADSNARVWINGQVVRRKVARYHEPAITCERVDAGPCLRKGENVIVVLHHSWGEILTFQRSANEHAGLWVESDYVVSDETWRCKRAPEYRVHGEQIMGIAVQAYRIRYAQFIDGREALGEAIHAPEFNDRDWPKAHAVSDGPWPERPEDVETPGQREYPVLWMSVLAAGDIETELPVAEDGPGITARIRAATHRPRKALARAAGVLAEADVTARPFRLRGKAGQTRYLTLDFHRPVHGYPLLELETKTPGIRIDLAYCEIARTLYAGEYHVRENGWINPEGVVGAGYCDRYTTRAGRQSVELTDERTVRWLALHIHFEQDATLLLHRVAVVKSQYPIAPLGRLRCGDERMEQIIKLCEIHAEVTMSDAYVDTPGREDGQWIEDNRPRALIGAFWFGDARLRQLMIRTIAQGQGSDGHLHPFFPSNFPAYPAWFDWSVQWVATLWDDYLWTGQTERARREWPVLCNYWERVLAHVDAEGLWRTPFVIGDIRWGRHLNDPRQSSGQITPWIIERLGWSIRLADALGEEGQARAWKETHGRMVEAFRKHHVVAAAGRVPAHVATLLDTENPATERGFSQSSQTVAVTCEEQLLNPREAKAALQYAFKAPDGSPPAGVDRWNNPTNAYRSLRALTRVGLGERALAHLLERYGPYLPRHPRNPVPLALQGPLGGPLPEYWISREDAGVAEGQINPAQPEDETGSHGWGAVPLLWIVESVLGVSITEPGGGRLRIAPERCGLPYLEGSVATPHGLLRIHLDPRQRRLEVALPAGVTAEIVAPREWKGLRLKAGEGLHPCAANCCEAIGPGLFTLTCV